ncbi:MAG: DNA mismatch repair endonuclease MutL [Dehalococcoidia bacterium]
MPIQTLPPIVVSKIAAGEVVERPSSVVKELIENSLDSGATQISIEVKGGGKDLIRVSDNGSGIAEGEIELAFHRHATSKISSEADIENLSTLGFRGEALPTIASVSDVSLITRNAGDVAGTSLKLESGVIKSRSKQGAPPGTTVTVTNLFQNVPARLKFLKSTSTESGHISHMVTQYSMAYPEVKLELLINGRTTLRSPGNGSLKDVLVEAYGLDIAESMIELSHEGLLEGHSVRLSGFVSPPTVSRSNRNYLSFFVNRRWVQSRMLNYSAEEAYRGMLISGKHPVVVLNIFIPSSEVDVNVHPTKREVKFRDEGTIFTTVQKAVREALIGKPVVPAINERTQLTSNAIPSPIPLPETARHTPYQARQALTEVSRGEVSTHLPILRIIGQFHGTYILAEGPDGLFLIDQHAAHERVLFEKVRRQQADSNIEVQGLLEPVSVDLTASQAEVISTHLDELRESGFDIEQFGERTYLLRAIPAFLSRQEIVPFLLETIDFLDDLLTSSTMERIAASLACHGAIKARQALSLQEMEQLLRELEETASPRTCPHGRPSIISLDLSRLEREFGR